MSVIKDKPIVLDNIKRNELPASWLSEEYKKEGGTFTVMLKPETETEQRGWKIKEVQQALVEAEDEKNFATDKEVQAFFNKW